MSYEVLRNALVHAEKFLAQLPNRLVRAQATREQLMALLSAPLSEQGEDPAATVDVLARAGEQGTMASAGPRYFGFVIGGSLPVSVAADWLTTTWDQNSGLYATSPIASVVEDVASEWLLELFGLPKTASVGFVTGCQMANFTGLAAGRYHVLKQAGWHVEEDGLTGAPPINIVVGDEAHVTIFAGLRMLGLGSRNVKRIPADAQGRLRAEELKRLLPTLKGPIIICAQAGNVNTGSFDPLDAIAEQAREHGAWLHVDGAFGLWGAVSPDLKPLLEGIELADSWATDGHKWLNVPYDSGISICAHPEAHRAAMGSSAAYLINADSARDPYLYTPEFSRRARGVTVYAALRSLGRRGVRDLVERCCAHARLFAQLLEHDKRVKILNDVVLNQVLVRFGDDDEFTRAVISRVQEEGTCWLSGTTWHKLAAMRISVSNWSTTTRDVEISAQAILRAVEAVSGKAVVTAQAR
jgi:glutamate/tyrosine decarboxylase-like PLP-dependent enzyme